LVRCAIGIVVNTVEKEVIEFAALSVHVERSIAAAVCGVLEDIAANARNQGRKIGIGTAVERKVLNLACADYLATLAGIGLQQLGCIADRDNFTRRANLECDIDTLMGVDLHLEDLRRRSAETGGLRGHRVVAHLHIGELIGSLSVGGDRYLRTCFLVDQGNGGIGHHRPRGIAYITEDRRGLKLREASRRVQD